MRKLLKRICIFFVAVFFLAAAVIGAGGYGMYRKALDKKSMFAMQEEIQANYNRVKQEVQQIVTDEMERIKNDPNLQHLIKTEE